MKDIVTMPAILRNIKTKGDRSLVIDFETAFELDGIDAAMLYSLRQTQGFMAFSPNEIDLEDIPEGEADADLNQKSSSQRLRNVLYVFWQQKGSPGTFEQFYTTQMNRLIEGVKLKLEPEGE